MILMSTQLDRRLLRFLTRIENNSVKGGVIKKPVTLASDGLLSFMRGC